MTGRPFPAGRLARLTRAGIVTPPGMVLVNHALAWQALKADYPQLHRHELAHVEEGPRAGADGWVHAR